MITVDPLDFHSVDSAGFCRSCGELVADLPPAARYCPGCGTRVRPPLSRLAHLRRFVSGLYARPQDEVVATGPTTPILVGYGNALFSLGWRYERGAAARRNLPEAIRCYRKSARLGNEDAAVRLGLSPAADDREATPVLPLDDEPVETPLSRTAKRRRQRKRNRR